MKLTPDKIHFVPGRVKIRPGYVFKHKAAITDFKSPQIPMGMGKKNKRNVSVCNLAVCLELLPE